MNRISVQLPKDLNHVLKRKAHVRGLSLSTFVRQMIIAGLSTSPGNTPLVSPKNCDELSLEMMTETLFLVRYLIQDEHVITEAQQKMSEALKKLKTEEGESYVA